MKYLLLGDNHKTLFVENDEQTYSLRFDLDKKKWVCGGLALWNARIGFDDSEPEDSIYRYGCDDCMPSIKEITHEEAKAFISNDIDEKDIEKLLKEKKRN